MTHLVVWERHRRFSEPLRTSAHRVTEELPRQALCGAIVPELGEHADVIYRQEQIPADVEECRLCVALEPYALEEQEAVA